MELQCDSRILSKDGILLFTQRYLNHFHITILPQEEYLRRIIIDPKSVKTLIPSMAELQNELLECEFIACRYAETKKLRADVEDRIIRAADNGENYVQE